jgi:hypothetical protein
MKLFFAFLFSVVYSSIPKLFEFDGLQNKTSEERRELNAHKEKVNKKLDEMAAKDIKLEFEVKRFFNIMQGFYFSLIRSKDIYEIVKSEIAYETITGFFQLKLASFEMDESFLEDLHNMFYEYEILSRKEIRPVRETTPADFVKDIILKNKTEFTAEEFEAISKETPDVYHNVHQYLLLEYLVTLDKDQIINKLIFHEFPRSSEKLLCLSNDDFNLSMKNASKSFLKRLEGEKTFDLLKTALPKLLKIALPEINNFKWLNIPPYWFNFENLETPSEDSMKYRRKEIIKFQTKVNERLNKIQPDSLAVEIKKYLDIMQNFFVNSLRTAKVGEMERLEFAYFFMAEHLRPQLETSGIDTAMFFHNLYEMFDNYEMFSRKGPQDQAIVTNFRYFFTFFKDLVNEKANLFDKETLNFLKSSYMSYSLPLFRYATVEYFKTLKKDQVFKIVFQGNIPLSFTGKSLDVAIGDDSQFPLFLEGVSGYLLWKLNLAVSNEREPVSNDRLCYYDEVKTLKHCIHDLVDLTLPEVKKRNWISNPANDDVNKSSNNNTNIPDSSNDTKGGKDNSSNIPPTDTGLLGGNGKIFVAVCVVLVVIALLGGGIAFWRLRLRKQNPVAPSA